MIKFLLTALTYKLNPSTLSNIVFELEPDRHLKRREELPLRTKYSRLICAEALKVRKLNKRESWNTVIQSEAGKQATFIDEICNRRGLIINASELNKLSMAKKFGYKITKMTIGTKVNEKCLPFSDLLKSEREIGKYIYELRDSQKAYCNFAHANDKFNKATA